ncbi:M17 family peptidase N-terminal domain-containing protein, partial [Zhongshania sp.]
MQISLKPCKDVSTVNTDCLILVTDAKLSSELAKAVDSASGGVISQLLKRGDFKAKLGETLYLPSIAGLKARRLLVVGKGDGKLDDNDFDKIIQATFSAPAAADCKDSCYLLDNISVVDRKVNWQYQRIAQLLVSSSYRYTATVSKPKPPLSIRRVCLQGANTEANRKAIQVGSSIGKGINTACELGDLPGNICTPEYIASEARSLGRKFQSITVSVLDEKKMKQLGMGALLSVSAG